MSPSDGAIRAKNGANVEKWFHKNSDNPESRDLTHLSLALLKKGVLPFSGKPGKIKAGSLCSTERIYILDLFCRAHLYTKLALQNTQKSRWL